MFRDTYYDHLRRIPLFADLDRSELEMIAKMVTELHYSEGTVLFTEGTRGTEMFIVVEGVTEVTRERVYIADIGPGGFAGEMALLTDSPRNSTVTAKTDVQVLHIDRRSFQTMLQEAPRIAVKMLPVVARRAAANSQFAGH